MRIGPETGKMLTVLDIASRKIERDRQAEENRLAAGANIRGGFPGGDDARKAADEARERLAGLVIDARLNKLADFNLDALKGAGLDEAFSSGLTRGAFATRGFGGRAFGESSFAGRQAKAAEAAVPLLQQIRDKVVNGKPLVLGV